MAKSTKKRPVDEDFLRAMRARNFNALKRYLEDDVDINSGFPHGNSSPLLVAALDGHLDLAKFLLERGADIEKKNEHQVTPLFAAVIKDKHEVAEFLLKKGARTDIHHANAGATPLHAAAMNGQIRMVKLLLEHGADPNQTNQYGDTALHSAAANGHHEIVKLLIENGANAGMKNREGITPHELAEKGHEMAARTEFKNRDPHSYEEQMRHFRAAMYEITKKHLEEADKKRFEHPLIERKVLARFGTGKDKHDHFDELIAKKRKKPNNEATKKRMRR